MGLPLLTTTFSYSKAGWMMEFTRIWKRTEEKGNGVSRKPTFLKYWFNYKIKYRRIFGG